MYPQNLNVELVPVIMNYHYLYRISENYAKIVYQDEEIGGLIISKLYNENLNK